MFWEEDKPLFVNSKGTEFYKIYEFEECLMELGIDQDFQVYGVKHGEDWEYVAVRSGQVVYSTQDIYKIDYAIQVAIGFSEFFS